MELSENDKEKKDQDKLYKDQFWEYFEPILGAEEQPKSSVYTPKAKIQMVRDHPMM